MNEQPQKELTYEELRLRKEESEMKANIENASITILFELDGRVYLVGMKKGKYDVVSFLAKASAEQIYKTDLTQRELRKLLGVDK